MFKRRIARLAAAAVAIASALTGLAITSPSAAHAATVWYWICQPTGQNTTPKCIANTPHQGNWTITTNAALWAQFNFNSSYIDHNGNTWWQMQDQSGLCLNWVSSTNHVYADSCPPGDQNELWSNHAGYTFDNLAAALQHRVDAWLTDDGTHLFVTFGPNNPRTWQEIPASVT